MPRGGRRAPKPGAAYSNRSDLNSRLPAQAATGQPYGQAGQQLAAQQAVPMGSPPVPPPAQGAAPTDQGNHPEPGSLGDFLMPTVRPDEHVMTGAPTGPGAGPEVLPALAPDPVVKGLAILNSLGSRLPPELKQVQQYLQASQQNATPA